MRFSGSKLEAHRQMEVLLIRPQLEGRTREGVSTPIGHAEGHVIIGEREGCLTASRCRGGLRCRGNEE